MHRILFLQRILPHYRTGFFKKFSEKYRDTTVLFGQPFSGESLQNAKSDMDFKYEICRNVYLGSNGKIFISGIYGRLSKQRPGIVISVFNTGNLNLYLLLFLKTFLKFKLILWSFGYDPGRGFNPAESFSDKLRLMLSEKSDAVIFYWQKGLDEVKKYSEKSSHFFVAPNTLDTDKLIQLKKKFDTEGKAKIKSELGITKTNHFIYVGRLIQDKQVDLLIKAFAIVSEKNPDTELSIIGDGPESGELKKTVSDLQIRNVNFLGEITDEELSGKWIYASEAFVMPGRLGLSVVHSFCFGTPVISQNKKSHFHGEGIGYIKEGENGFLTEDGNTSALAGKMLWFTQNHDGSQEMRTNAFKTANTECSIENMISGFTKAIDYVNSGG